MCAVSREAVPNSRKGVTRGLFRASDQHHSICLAPDDSGIADLKRGRCIDQYEIEFFSAVPEQGGKLGRVEAVHSRATCRPGGKNRQPGNTTLLSHLAPRGRTILQIGTKQVGEAGFGLQREDLVYPGTSQIGINQQYLLAYFRGGNGDV